MILYYIILYYLILYYLILSYIILYNIIFSYIMLCYVMLYYVILYYLILSYIMLCYVILYFIILMCHIHRCIIDLCVYLSNCLSISPCTHQSTHPSMPLPRRSHVQPIHYMCFWSILYILVWCYSSAASSWHRFLQRSRTRRQMTIWTFRISSASWMALPMQSWCGTAQMGWTCLSDFNFSL